MSKEYSDQETENPDKSNINRFSRRLFLTRTAAATATLPKFLEAQQGIHRPSKLEQQSGINFETTASFVNGKIETVVKGTIGESQNINLQFRNKGAEFNSILGPMHTVASKFFSDDFAQEILETHKLRVISSHMDLAYDPSTATFIWKYVAQTKPATSLEIPHNSITARGNIRANHYSPTDTIQKITIDQTRIQREILINTTSKKNALNSKLITKHQNKKIYFSSTEDQNDPSTIPPITINRKDGSKWIINLTEQITPYHSRTKSGL